MPSYSYLCKKAGLPVPGPAPHVPQKRHPLPPAAPVPRAPIALTPSLTANRLNLSAQASELFDRLFAQLGAHEKKHFGPIYELAIKLFPVVYGKMPCDVPRFQALRTTVANGGKVPLFE